MRISRSVSEGPFDFEITRVDSITITTTTTTSTYAATTTISRKLDNTVTTTTDNNKNNNNNNNDIHINYNNMNSNERISTVGKIIENCFNFFYIFQSCT